MKFSLMFYNAILDRTLDLNTFNKHVTLKNQTQFWDQLVNQFVFNNNENNKVHKTYDALASDNNIIVEWFKDILCLIYQMVNTVNLHPCFRLIKFDTLDSNKNENNWQGKLKNILSNLDSIDNGERTKRVRRVAETMLHSLKEIYDASTNTQQTQEPMSHFILNRLFKAILIHNNFNEDEVRPISFQVKLPQFTKQNCNASDSSEALMRAAFKHEIWQQVDKHLISVLFNKNGDVEDLTLMRMLILTVNFMVESEATLNTNIKCINFDEKETDDQRLDNEIKTNGLYNDMDCNARKKVNMLSRIVEQLYNDKRNVQMGVKMLTRNEITCIYLITRENVNKQVKSAHRRGETCKYRCLSYHIISGLSKLKHHDQSNNFEKISYIYSGISNVTFDINKVTQNKSIEKLLQTYLDKNKENYNILKLTNQTNSFLSLDTFTSTSEDVEKAREFSEKFIGDGIILKIDFPKLWLNDSILCGDVSWISNFPHEQEILVAPCMLWIHKLDTNDKISKQKNTKVYFAELRRLRNPSMLIRRLKNEIAETAKHVHVNDNDDSNKDHDHDHDQVKIDLNKLNKEEKEAYDCIKQVLPKECDKYFNILQKEDCLDKQNLKDLNHVELKEIGVKKLGHRKSLLRAFNSL